MTPSAVPDTFADPSFIGPSAARDLNFTPKSASVGLIQNLPWHGLVGKHHGAICRARAQARRTVLARPARATATFDIGDPNLRIEKARSVEVGLRKPTGPFRFEATAYHTRFNGFIFRRLTGNTCDDASCVDPADPAAPLELNQARYTQRDATFRGGEFQFQWDIHPMWRGFFGVEGQYDIVRATFTDGTNVPRIPPQRIGGGRVFPQRRVARAGEHPACVQSRTTLPWWERRRPTATTCCGRS